MKIQINKIKEVYPGVFWSLLDYPKADLIGKLLKPDYPFILCWSHRVGNNGWQKFSLPIIDPIKVESVWANTVEFSFCCMTEQFLGFLPKLGPGLKAVQLKNIPPYYLDLEKIKGKELWRILNECGWYVLLDTPGNDYGEIASPNKEVVEEAISIIGSDNENQF